MSKKIVIPVFSSEAEDAAWHDAHMNEIEDEMVRQMKAGTAIVGGEGARLPFARPSNLSPICIRLAKTDIAAAKEQASHRGMAYQTYIRAVLHQALKRNARRK